MSKDRSYLDYMSFEPTENDMNASAGVDTSLPANPHPRDFQTSYQPTQAGPHVPHQSYGYASSYPLQSFTPSYHGILQRIQASPQATMPESYQSRPSAMPEMPQHHGASTEGYFNDSFAMSNMVQNQAGNAQSYPNTTFAGPEMARRGAAAPSKADASKSGSSTSRSPKKVKKPHVQSSRSDNKKDKKGKDKHRKVTSVSQDATKRTNKYVSRQTAAEAISEGASKGSSQAELIKHVLKSRVHDKGSFGEDPDQTVRRFIARAYGSENEVAFEKYILGRWSTVPLNALQEAKPRFHELLNLKGRTPSQTIAAAATQSLKERVYWPTALLTEKDHQNAALCMTYWIDAQEHETGVADWTVPW